MDTYRPVVVGGRPVDDGAAVGGDAVPDVDVEGRGDSAGDGRGVAATVVEDVVVVVVVVVDVEGLEEAGGFDRLVVASA